jgi:hypothetical protein
MTKRLQNPVMPLFSTMIRLCHLIPIMRLTEETTIYAAEAEAIAAVPAQT